MKGPKGETPDGKPLFAIRCINCNSKIIGTARQLISMTPICSECRKARVRRKNASKIEERV